MKQYTVKGKFEIEFSGVVDAENAVQAEEKVARTYRRVLNDTVNVPGRPYDVKVKEIADENSDVL
jgi:hypothetical protein